MMRQTPATPRGGNHRFSTLRCGSWIDALRCCDVESAMLRVSVPFDAGRGLMPLACQPYRPCPSVSVPFDAGRGLMQVAGDFAHVITWCFSTLRCGSWIDAARGQLAIQKGSKVSVPFDAGRGLMRWGRRRMGWGMRVSVPFDAGRGLMRRPRPKISTRH